MSTSEMATQFAVGLFPITQGFCRRRKSRGQAKGVQQAVRRKSFEVAAIGVSSGKERPGAETHAFHGEGNCLERDNLARRIVR